MSGETQNGKMSAEELAQAQEVARKPHRFESAHPTKWSDLTERLLAHIAALQREAEAERARADAMREALEAIKAGRIDLQFDEKTDRPMWHVAFVQLQSIARAALSQASGEPSLSSEGK